jgi:arsenite-transporting ATPase
MMRLQDPAQTKVIVVTLAETTPVLEAANLQADLRRAGIEPWAWVINNSLTVSTTSSPLLKQRAAFELAQIEAVKTNYAQRFALVPMQVDEPVGIQELLNLGQQKTVTAAESGEIPSQPDLVTHQHQTTEPG